MNTFRPVLICQFDSLSRIVCFLSWLVESVPAWLPKASALVNLTTPDHLPLCLSKVCTFPPWLAPRRYTLWALWSPSKFSGWVRQRTLFSTGSRLPNKIIDHPINRETGYSNVLGPTTHPFQHRESSPICATHSPTSLFKILFTEKLKKKTMKSDYAPCSAQGVFSHLPHCATHTPTSLFMRPMGSITFAAKQNCLWHQIHPSFLPLLPHNLKFTYLNLKTPHEFYDNIAWRHSTSKMCWLPLSSFSKPITCCAFVVSWSQCRLHCRVTPNWSVSDKDFVRFKCSRHNIISQYYLNYRNII